MEIFCKNEQQTQILIMSMRSTTTKDKQGAKRQSKSKKIEKAQSAPGSPPLQFKRTNANGQKKETSLRGISLTQNKSKKQQNQTHEHVSSEDRQEEVLSSQQSSAPQIMDEPSGVIDIGSSLSKDDHNFVGCEPPIAKIQETVAISNSWRYEEEPPADKFKRQLEKQRSQLIILKVAIVDFIRKLGVFLNSKSLETQTRMLSNQFYDTKRYKLALDNAQKKISFRFDDKTQALQVMNADLISLRQSEYNLKKQIQNWKHRHESASQSNQFLSRQSSQLFLTKNQLTISQNKVRQLEERVRKEDKLSRAIISEKNQDIRNLQIRIRNMEEHAQKKHEDQVVKTLKQQFSTLKFDIQNKYKTGIESIQLKHTEQIQKLSKQWKQQVDKIQKQYKTMKQQTDQLYSQQIQRADNTAKYYRQLSSLNLQKLDKLNEAASIIVISSKDTINALNNRLESQEKHKKILKNNITVHFNKFLQMTKQTVDLEQNYQALAQQINFFRDQNWFQILQNAYLANIIIELQTQICQKIQKQAALQKQYDDKVQQMHQEIITNINSYQQILESQLTKVHQSHQIQITTMLADQKCQVDTLTNQIQTFKGLLQMQDKMFDMAEQCSQKTIDCLQAKLQTVTQKNKKQMKNYRQEIESLDFKVQELNHDKFQLLKIKQSKQIELQAQRKRCDKINTVTNDFFSNLGKKSFVELIDICEVGFSNTVDNLVTFMRFFKAEYGEVKAKLDECQIVKTQLSQQLAKANRQLGVFKSDRDQLMEDKDSKSSEVNRLQDKCIKIGEQLENLKVQKQSNQNNLNGKIKELEATCLSLNLKIVGAQKAESKLQAEIKSLRENVLAKEKEKQQIKSEISIIIEERNQLRDEIDKKQDEKDKKMEEIQKSKHKLSQQQMNREQIKTQLKNKQKQIVELSKNINQLQNKLKSQQKHLKEQENKLKQQQNQLKDLKYDNQQLTKDLSNVQMQLEQSEKENNQKTISKQQPVSSTLAQKVSDLQKKLASAQKTNRDLEVKLNSKKQTEVLTSSSNLVAQENELYKQQIEMLKQQNQQLRQNIQILQDKIKRKQNTRLSPKPLLKEQTLSNSQMMRMKSEIFEPKQQDNHFSSKSQLDSFINEKNYLISSIEKVTEKTIKQTNLLFSMNKNSKFRSFSLIVAKNSVSTDEHYVFVFIVKNSQGKKNIVTVTVIKNKDVKNNWAFLAACTKQETYLKKQITKNDAYSFDFTGQEVSLGGTFKVKSNDNMLKIAANTSPYFDAPTMTSILEKQAASFELQAMEVYKLVLE